MQKPTATAASSGTRLIPLKKLRVDERNVRSASADPARVQADAELAASIKSHGLLENLVVVPRGKTQFGVAAGARRLRALKALAADSHLPKDHPVPCLVVDGDAATESSLAENAVRIAMHPADQVVAFGKLAPFWNAAGVIPPVRCACTAGSATAIGGTCRASLVSGSGLRDRDGSPQGRDPVLRGSVRSTTARPPKGGRPP